jgi:hypothetical protein
MGFSYGYPGTYDTPGLLNWTDVSLDPNLSFE